MQKKTRKGLIAFLFFLLASQMIDILFLNPRVTGSSIFIIGAILIGLAYFLPLQPCSRMIVEELPELSKPQVNEINSLATEYTTLYEQGRIADSIPFAEQLVALREKHFGPDHPDVATVVNNLGIMYAQEGRYEEAERQFKRALDIKEKAPGHDGQSIASTLEHLAELYQTQGRDSEATRIYSRSTAIRRAATNQVA